VYGLPPARVRVIPYGVRRFAEPGRRPEAVRGRPYILFAGRIVPHRNIERLVAAFLSIQDRVEHDLVLAGEAFYDVDIPRDHPRIVRLGHVSDGELHALYRGASVFAFPSLGEGFGLPPLEAMSCGCPVVAAPAASLPEVCGAAALWVDARSVPSIADGLCAVLLDEGLRERLARAGRQRASELTWERSARAHLELLAEVRGGGVLVGAR
jgi:glycosyltransferase involved in cell wall biosynthesis